VFDTIDNFDGLESLIVIGLDFDQSDGDNEGRSACYRLITRAQMLLVLVGGVYSDGYFGWLRRIRFNAEPTIGKGRSEGGLDFIVDKNAAMTFVRKMTQKNRLVSPTTKYAASPSPFSPFSLSSNSSERFKGVSSSSSKFTESNTTTTTTIFSTSNNAPVFEHPLVASTSVIVDSGVESVSVEISVDGDCVDSGVDIESITNEDETVCSQCVFDTSSSNLILTRDLEAFMPIQVCLMRTLFTSNWCILHSVTCTCVVHHAYVLVTHIVWCIT
jgi:hypothetical protein